MRRDKSFLKIIILAALLIRFWGIGHNPNGLSFDEAANGYNAYSIWKTGKDPYGRFLPFLMLAHEFDYIESLYTYLLVPSVAILGLNETSVRAVSALFGVLTIWSTFLLIRKLFGARVALMTCLFLAFSPWHVIQTRFCARPCMLPFFITLGLYLFLEGLERPRMLPGAGVALGISAYTYSTIRVFLPLLLIGVIIIYRKEIMRPRNRKWFIGAALLIIMIALPIAVAVTSGTTSPRFEQISVFNADAPLRTFLKNYAAHYTPSFLFVSGDRNLRHNPTQMGQELIVLAPFMAIGLIRLVIRKNKSGILIIYWIIIAAVPAAFTNEGIPHGIRSFQFIPTLEALAAIGIVWIWDMAGALKRAYVLRAIISCAVAVNIAFFIFNLFFIYPTVSAPWWQFGIRDALAGAIAAAGPEEPIYITGDIREPYIYVLFYAQKDPRPWQTGRSLGRFILCKDEIKKYYDSGRPGIYVARPGEIPGSRQIKLIRFPSGQPAFEIISGKEHHSEQ